jgi:hypothetical protein
VKHKQSQSARKLVHLDSLDAGLFPKDIDAMLAEVHPLEEIRNGPYRKSHGDRSVIGFRPSQVKGHFL